MRRAVLITLGLLVNVAGASAGDAATVARSNNVSGEPCLEAGYDHVSFLDPTPIPDGEACGVMIGPLPVPNDGTAIEGVVLRIQVSHPNTPDLELRLCYDVDNDGRSDASVALEPYLARRTACVTMERYGCPAVLDGIYYFRDGYHAGVDGAEPKPQGELHDPIVKGVDVSFTIFDGLRRGGTFYLAAVDSLAGDTGVVEDWTVFTRQPIFGAVR